MHAPLLTIPLLGADMTSSGHDRHDQVSARHHDIRPKALMALNQGANRQSKARKNNEGGTEAWRICLLSERVTCQGPFKPRPLVLRPMPTPLPLPSARSDQCRDLDREEGVQSRGMVT